MNAVHKSAVASFDQVHLLGLLFYWCLTFLPVFDSCPSHHFLIKFPNPSWHILIPQRVLASFRHFSMSCASLFNLSCASCASIEPMNTSPAPTVSTIVPFLGRAAGPCMISVPGSILMAPDPSS